MKPLKLPPTVNTPDIELYANNEVVCQAIIKRHNSKVVEGYTVDVNVGGGIYKYYAEINIDNDRLWLLFKYIVIGFTGEVALIYHHRDFEPSYGCYLDKYVLLNGVEKYEKELVEDGNLMFGVTHQSDDDSVFEEVFIHRTKYIQCWGMNIDKFKGIMEKFELYQVDGLNFVGEFPLETVPLTLLFPDCIDTLELIEVFDDLYKSGK